jgi:predicted enzyme involved in methoxymalonyl-ACP biosynthesis
MILRKKKLSNYRIALNRTTQEVEKITEKFDSRIDALVAANIDDDTSTEERTRVQQSIRESQTNMFGPRLLDPLDIRTKITEMEDEITFLTTEFDYVLSTSNTVTMIEVEV